MKVLLVYSETKPELTKQLLMEWGFFVDSYCKNLYFSDDNLQVFQKYVIDHDIDLVIPIGTDAELFCDFFKQLGWPDRFLVSSMSDLVSKLFKDEKDN